MSTATIKTQKLPTFEIPTVPIFQRSSFFAVFPEIDGYNKNKRRIYKEFFVHLTFVCICVIACLVGFMTLRDAHAGFFVFAVITITLVIMTNLTPVISGMLYDYNHIRAIDVAHYKQQMKEYNENIQTYSKARKEYPAIFKQAVESYAKLHGLCVDSTVNRIRGEKIIKYRFVVEYPSHTETVELVCPSLDKPPPCLVLQE